MLERLKKTLKKKQVGDPRRVGLVARALAFASMNPKVIILILDPKKEDIIAAYGREYLVTNIRTRFAKLKVKVVSQLLKDKDTKKNILRILAVMEEFLHKLVEKLNPKVGDNKSINQDNYAKKENRDSNGDSKEKEG